MILYLIHLIILSCIILAVYTQRGTQFHQSIFWTGLGIRLIGSVSFVLIYTQYIQYGDSLSFFKKASDLADSGRSDFVEYLDFVFSSQHHIYKSEGRDGFFIKLVSVLCLLTNNSYWISTLYMSILSFIPIWYFVSLCASIFPKHKLSLVAAFLVLPSPIFWTSVLLKDSLVFISIVLITSTLVKYCYKHKIKWLDILGLVLSFFLLWKLRYFLFGIAFGVVIIVAFEKLIARRIEKNYYKGFIWLALVVLCTVGISFINPNLYFQNFPQAIYDNYHIILSNSSPETSIVFRNLQPDWKSLTFCLPLSFLSGLFRPILTEGGLVYLLHGLENSLILILSLFTLAKLRRIGRPPILVWCGIGFILVLASLYPLASPNFGTLMRYKASYLPFLFFLLSITPFQAWFQKKA
ncbi:MAG: hypothetical protein JXR03_08765 [Cyclobacteriaceae bacterium]